jgi:hypothetical protein
MIGPHRCHHVEDIDDGNDLGDEWNVVAAQRNVGRSLAGPGADRGALIALSYEL